MKRYLHMLPILLALNSVVLGGGHELFPLGASHVFPKQEMPWVSPDFTGAVTPDKEDVLQAFENYEGAVLRYGSTSRQAQAAAGDLEAEIAIYLERQEP